MLTKNPDRVYEYYRGVVDNDNAQAVAINPKSIKIEDVVYYCDIKDVGPSLGEPDVKKLSGGNDANRPDYFNKHQLYKKNKTFYFYLLDL